MAGVEEDSSKQSTTKIMAADERPVGGDECVLKHVGPVEERTLMSCATKRKREAAAAGDGKLRTIKRKTADSELLEQGSTAGYSELLEQGSAAVAKHEEDEAPVRKMTRLPQEEIQYILGLVMDDSRAPRDYKALKRRNPDLIPSPEEEMDQRLVGLYAGARVFYAIGERFSNFQARIRNQYDKHGYVEVDDDFLASRAQIQSWNDEAREEALKQFDFSDMDDDMKRVFLNF
jgi:hypothetical protein